MNTTLDYRLVNKATGWADPNLFSSRSHVHDVAARKADGSTVQFREAGSQGPWIDDDAFGRDSERDWTAGVKPEVLATFPDHEGGTLGAYLHERGGECPDHPAI
jgi:hypothetical protein